MELLRPELANRLNFCPLKALWPSLLVKAFSKSCPEFGAEIFLLKNDAFEINAT